MTPTIAWHSRLDSQLTVASINGAKDGGDGVQSVATNHVPIEPQPRDGYHCPEQQRTSAGVKPQKEKGQGTAGQWGVMRVFKRFQ